MSSKITPAFIMNQIRNGVRAKKKTTEELKLEQQEEIQVNFNNGELSQTIAALQIGLKRLQYRITPNIPVAFLEPHLVSRFKLLGKIIVPLRRLGARLFTKWYADTFVNQQKHLNKDIWFGLNSITEIANDQQKLIFHLINKNNELEAQITQLTSVITDIRSNHTELQQDMISKLDEAAASHTINLEAKINLVMDEIKKSTFLDFDYSKFAEQFSADRETVRRIYAQYIHYFKNKNYVLDIGCGKGYFMELLRDHNIPSVGIDTDTELIKICKDKGLSAYTADALGYLEKLPNNSVGGIFTGHVIEHLPSPTKIKFLKLCFDKLTHDGVLVIETPNTSSPHVMHNLYYLDPTHEKPMFHETYKYLAADVGFAIENSYLSEPIEGTDPQQYYNFSLILSKQ
ncbi:class I SAM-dependent methyltransferase [Paenibacillus cremeus]|nr:class I SAM-dependent methyltransferase [Paenibacillus cremeus]